MGEDYERETYENVRISYEKMMKELNDSVNNVLTMTSFDLENSMKSSFQRLRDSVIAFANVVTQEQPVLSKPNRSSSKNEVSEIYKEIFNDDPLFDVEPSRPSSYSSITTYVDNISQKKVI